MVQAEKSINDKYSLTDIFDLRNERPVKEQVATLSDFVEKMMYLVLKIPELIDNSIIYLSSQLSQMQSKVSELEQKVSYIEQNSAVQQPAGQQQKSYSPVAPPPPPKSVNSSAQKQEPVSQDNSPLSLRKGIMNELKALFEKRNGEGKNKSE